MNLTSNGESNEAQTVCSCPSKASGNALWTAVAWCVVSLEVSCAQRCAAVCTFALRGCLLIRHGLRCIPAFHLGGVIGRCHVSAKLTDRAARVLMLHLSRRWAAEFTTHSACADDRVRLQEPLRTCEGECKLGKEAANDRGGAHVL